MSNQLEQLPLVISNYRESVNMIFTTSPTPSELRSRFYDVLICTSRLYLDYLLITRQLETAEMVPSEYVSIPANLQRERIHREQLRAQLESWPNWKYFHPQKGFPEQTDLQTLADYINCLALHLSEIYEESFRVKQCAKEFLLNQNDSAGGQLIVGLEHMGRHHISFVQQALEWVSADSMWDDD